MSENEDRMRSLLSDVGVMVAKTMIKAQDDAREVGYGKGSGVIVCDAKDGNTKKQLEIRIKVETQIKVLG